MTDANELADFWASARHQTRINPVPGYLGTYAAEAVPPPAWSFGTTTEQADELLALVLDGTKTATASALWDYEYEGEQIPPGWRPQHPARQLRPPAGSDQHDPGRDRAIRRG